MKPNYVEKTLVVGGATEGAMFGISSKDEAHIMSILRDTLYTDRVLAVLREYGSNAWDAHKSVGKSNVPIKVTIPKMGSPTLSIRDFGPGLSKEGIFRVYTQYGASSKRDSDEAVGMMGIGSKSAFAYSDTFTITSWHGGVCSLYSATLDPTNKGVINLLHEYKCGDETGIQIDIPVRSQDFWSFENNSKYLFKYFSPRPEINIELEEDVDGKDFPGIGKIFVTPGTYNSPRGWVALMGCIPYRISLDKLVTSGENMPGYFRSTGGVLYFDIGDVQVSASREELKYGESTIKKVRGKLFDLIDTYVDTALKDIKARNLTDWDCLVKKRELSDLGLLSGAINLSYVSIKDGYPLNLYGHRTKGPATSIKVHQKTRLLVKDDDRLISGFTHKEGELMVRPLKGKRTVDKDAFKKFLDDHGINGIPVEYTSNRAWSYSGKGGCRTITGARATVVPSAQRVFRYVPTTTSVSRPSLYWEYVPGKVPDKDDVYVVMEHFEADFDLNNRYYSDSSLLTSLGASMPTIYGYRDLKRDPIDKGSLQGKEYRTWYKESIQSLCDQNKDKVHISRYKHLFDKHADAYARNDDRTKIIEDRLGKDHILCDLYKALSDARAKYTDYTYMEMRKYDSLVDAAQSLEVSICEKDDLFKKCCDRYLLLTEIGMLQNLSEPIPREENLAAYLRYVEDTDIASIVRGKN